MCVVQCWCRIICSVLWLQSNVNRSFVSVCGFVTHGTRTRLTTFASKCVIHLFTGRPARSAAMPVLFLLSDPKMAFFAPQGRHIAPINVKFGTGSGPQVHYDVIA